MHEPIIRIKGRVEKGAEEKTGKACGKVRDSLGSIFQSEALFDYIGQEVEIIVRPTGE